MEREQIVRRHNPEFDRLDPLSPLSVGNGNLRLPQILPVRRHFQNNTRCRLAPSRTGAGILRGRERFSAKDAALQMFETHGRQVGYPMKPGISRKLTNGRGKIPTVFT